MLVSNLCILCNFISIQIVSTLFLCRYRSRKPHSLWEKIQAIERFIDLHENIFSVTACQLIVGEEFDANRSLISKWYRRRDELYEQARLLSQNKKDGFLNRHQLELCKRIGSGMQCQYPMEEHAVYKIMEMIYG